MALDPEFVSDCPYLPEGLFIDDLLEIDREGHGRIVARMPTLDDLPLTHLQRTHPTRHPRHVSGGLMIHVTGIAGMLHAYHVLGLRHRDGWIGYGARIHHGRFHALARIGPPLLIDCRASQMKKGATRAVVRYQFRFTQEGTEVYEGDQTAMFMKIDDAQH